MPEIYPKQFFRLRSARVQKASCFLMMPFAPKFDGVNKLLQGTLQSSELNIACRRADDIRSQNILETILVNIAKSEYVIADLTDCNPNVFYELGLAHCVKEAENVILLTQSMEFVPFDLRVFRCIVYEPSPSGMDGLRNELIKTFNHVARDSFRFIVHEGSRIEFGKKLVGHNSNLFELTFNVVHVGHGVVKMSIDFTEYAIDQETSKVEPQFLMLNEGEWSVQTVNNIPWRLHLSQYTADGAVLVLEKS